MQLGVVLSYIVITFIVITRIATKVVSMSSDKSVGVGSRNDVEFVEFLQYILEYFSQDQSGAPESV